METRTTTTETLSPSRKSAGVVQSLISNRVTSTPTSEAGAASCGLCFKRQLFRRFFSLSSPEGVKSPGPNAASRHDSASCPLQHLHSVIPTLSTQDQPSLALLPRVTGCPQTRKGVSLAWLKRSKGLDMEGVPDSMTTRCARFATSMHTVTCCDCARSSPSCRRTASCKQAPSVKAVRGSSRTCARGIQ